MNTHCRCDGTAMETDHCPACYCEEFEETCDRGVQFDRETGERRRDETEG